MDIIASHGFTLLALACVFGLFMACGIDERRLPVNHRSISDGDIG